MCGRETESVCAGEYVSVCDTHTGVCVGGAHVGHAGHHLHEGGHWAHLRHHLRLRVTHNGATAQMRHV